MSPRTLRLAQGLTLPLDAVSRTFGGSQSAADAWLAGLFEGEGCISHDVQKVGKRRMLSIVNTDIDVLERALAVAGHGVIVRKKVTGNRKPVWVWKVQKWREVLVVAKRIQPYLLSRRSKKLRKLLADPPTKSLGHCPVCKNPFEGPQADVYVKKSGAIQCAPCTRRRMRNIRIARMTS